MAARWGAGEETLTACNMDFFPMDTLDEVYNLFRIPPSFTYCTGSLFCVRLVTQDGAGCVSVCVCESYTCAWKSDTWMQM